MELTPLELKQINQIYEDTKAEDLSLIQLAVYAATGQINSNKKFKTAFTTKKEEKKKQIRKTDTEKEQELKDILGTFTRKEGE